MLNNTETLNLSMLKMGRADILALFLTLRGKPSVFHYKYNIRCSFSTDVMYWVEEIFFCSQEIFPIPVVNSRLVV